MGLHVIGKRFPILEAALADEADPRVFLLAGRTQDIAFEHRRQFGSCLNSQFDRIALYFLKHDLPVSWQNHPVDQGGTAVGGRRRSGQSVRGLPGERRRNETHASTTDPEAHLLRKGQDKEARLTFLGRALTGIAMAC